MHGCVCPSLLRIFLSVFTTFVEIKADSFKLLFLYKRPVPR